jgi:orotate phosphoribosyltransferase
MEWSEEKGNLGKKITQMLFSQGMIKTWYRDKPDGWVTVSGLWSPFYIQLRPLSSYANSREILQHVGTGMGKLIRHEAPHVNKLIGVAAAGIPIAVAITMQEGIPSCYTRKLEGIKSIDEFESRIHEYGEHALIEGEIADGDVIGVVDDLVTRFDSKLLALEQVKHEIGRREKECAKKLNVTCKDIFVLLDREQGAVEKARSLDLNLYSLIPFKSKGIHWLKESLTKLEYDTIVDYLGNYAKYQDKNVQRKLTDFVTSTSKSTQRHD